MAKIECPHCHAINQDVSLNDPCWKCGTILSAPPSALETADGPPTSTANPATETKPLTKVQQALAQEPVEDAGEEREHIEADRAARSHRLSRLRGRSRRGLLGGLLGFLFFPLLVKS